jgi:RHS repeat-associated protein
LGSVQWSSGTYLYDGAGNIVSIGTDNYLYDGVQRLKQSSTQGISEAYTYDGFGNMKTRTNTIMPTPDPATNRYPYGNTPPYGYNEIGAVTSDGSYTFTYDALGQPLSKEYNNDFRTIEYYVYTPSDERIGVQRGAWWWWSVRDESGKVLRQYKSSATDPTQAALWVEDFVWRDWLLLGSQRPPEMGGRRHFHLDHLGTPRLITSDAGQMVSYHDYYPFGDEHSPIWQEGPSAGGFDREEPMKFTGQERDYAGGMGGEDGHAIDDMHARDYSPTVGRFFSPDPVLGNLLQPQSWNRYAYVLNAPINFTDPYGLEKVQQGKPVGPGDTCDGGVIVAGWCTSGEGITVNAKKDPTWYEANVAEFARARAKPLLAQARAYAAKHHLTAMFGANGTAIAPYFGGGSLAINYGHSLMARGLQHGGLVTSAGTGLNAAGALLSFQSATVTVARGDLLDQRAGGTTVAIGLFVFGGSANFDEHGLNSVTFGEGPELGFAITAGFGGTGVVTEEDAVRAVGLTPP